MDFLSRGNTVKSVIFGAGTSSAGTAPIKLTSGTNLGTTEAGAIEYDGTHLYFTATNSGTRYQLDQQAGGDMVLASVQTVTGAKTYNNAKLILAGSSSGTTILNAAAVAGSGTMTLPTGTDTLAGLGTIQTFTALQTFKGIATSDGGQLAAESLTTGTGTNWAGSNFTSGYTHTSGSTVALTSAFLPSINSYYQVSITATGTVGTLTPTIGGYSSSSFNFGSTTIFSLRASSTAALTITPSSTFDGVIIASVKVVTNSTPSTAFSNSSGTVALEIRASTDTTNQFIGLNAGTKNTSAGVNNTGNGNNSLSNNITGTLNTAQGYNSLVNNTTGSNNVAFGGNSGRFLTDASTLLTNSNNSIYVGANTYPLADNNTNEIIIGNNGRGLGSNTIAIGNSSTTFGRIWGRHLIGTSTDDGTNSLQIAGTSKGYSFDLNPVPNPTVPTAAVSAGGSVDTGSHWYSVSYVTATGETNVVYTAAVVITTVGNNTVTLTIPVSTDIRVTSRKIYRSKIASVQQYADFFVATVADNTTTTYVDTVADSTLVGSSPAGFYRTNTTSTFITVNSVKSFVLDKYITAIGIGAGAGITLGGRSTFIGYNAGNISTTGTDNTYIGYVSAGFSSSTGSFNTFVGSGSGSNITSGNSNTILGYSSLGANTTTSQNTAIGVFSLKSATASNNTAVGYDSGALITTGTQNVFLGVEAGNVAGQLITASNSIAIGYNTYTTASNQIIIGNTSTVNVGIGILGTNTSALLHLKAGSSVAGTAPLKLTSGVNLGTTEAGAIEYDGTHLYFTAVNSGTRYQLDQQSGSSAPTIVNQTTSTYSVVATSGTLIVLCDTTSNVITITLPTAIGNTATIIIKKTNSGTNNVTTGTSLSQTIDLGATAILKVQSASITLIGDNANWQII